MDEYNLSSCCVGKKSRAAISENSDVRYKRVFDSLLFFKVAGCNIMLLKHDIYSKNNLWLQIVNTYNISNGLLHLMVKFMNLPQKSDLSFSSVTGVPLENVTVLYCNYKLLFRLTRGSWARSGPHVAELRRRLKLVTVFECCGRANSTEFLCYIHILGNWTPPPPPFPPSSYIGAR